MFLPESIKKISLLLILLYSVYSLADTLISIHTNVIQKDQEYQNKILGLKTEKSDLEQKLELINSNEFVEKEARERLNMKKEGEEIYLITSNQAPQKEEIIYSDIAPKLNKPASNFDRWMEILF
jgi:cell division protein FtsB